jgi:hypothetical protein
MRRRNLLRSALLASTAGLAVATLQPGQSVQAQAWSPVQLPVGYVDTSYSLPTGCAPIPVGTAPTGACKIITVGAGQNFQTALNQARRGDIIQLAANATFVGPFELPDKGAGTDWVYVVSSALGSLPGPGNRLNPDLGGACSAEGSLPCGVPPNASLSDLPKIMSGGGYPYRWIQTAHGADRYRFIGIEFGATPGEIVGVGIRLYENAQGQFHGALSEKTSDIIFDRCLMRGSYTAPYAGRGVVINGDRHAVINSYLSGWVDDDTDTQAVLITGYAPVFAVVNNYLEASGENVYTDGAETIDGVTYVPSDGEIRGNLLRKLGEWNSRPWNNTKNQFEMKSGVRVLFEGNIVYSAWHLAQETSINIKIGDEDPRKFVSHVTIRNNIVRHVANGIKLCASQCNGTGNVNIATGLAVYNNIFDDVSTAFGDSGDGHGVHHIVAGPQVYLDHNTFLNQSEGINLVVRGTGVPDGQTLQITNNIWRTGANPLTAAEVVAASSAALYTNNVMVGGACGNFPAGNRCAPSWAAVGFNNYSNGVGGDYTLSPASPYKGVGTDPFGVGTTDPGANVALVNAATGCAFGGQCAGPSNSDITPPSVSMTAPSNGASVSGTITVSANASDNVGVVGVQFMVDGAAAGPEVPSAPYSISWNSASVPNGSRTITARARDAAGNMTVSLGMTVNVSNAGGGDSTPPTVSITAPANGAAVSGGISVTATANDNTGVAGVQFLVDGLNLGSEDTTSPYSVSWPTANYANGTHTLSARARDAAGNVTTSPVITVTVQNQTSSDTTPPTVAVTAPANGAAISGNVTISAAASDNVAVAGVQFRLDGLNLGPEILAAPYSMVWNSAGATAGSHTLAAVARDAAGNSRVATITVTVLNVDGSTDTTAPNVTMTAPANGATVSGSTVLSANATDNVAVATVQFVVDGVNVGQPVLAPPYSRVWDASTVAAGSHVVSAIARDAAGNSRSAVAVTINVRPVSFSPTAAPRGDVQRVSWTSLVKSRIYLWRLRKTDGCDSCADAGAMSSQRVTTGDGYLEVEGTNSPRVYYVGWGPVSPGTSPEDLDFGLRLNGRSADVFEAGVPKASQDYNGGDALRISVSGGVVTYLRNGRPFYTSQRAPIYPIAVRAVLMDRRAEITRALFWRATATSNKSAASLPGSGGSAPPRAPNGPVSGTPSDPRSPRTDDTAAREVRARAGVVDGDRASAGTSLGTWAMELLSTTDASVTALYFYAEPETGTADSPVFISAITRPEDPRTASEWDTAQRQKVTRAVSALTPGSYRVTAFAQIAMGAPYEIGTLTLIIR